MLNGCFSYLLTVLTVKLSTVDLLLACCLTIKNDKNVFIWKFNSTVNYIFKPIAPLNVLPLNPRRLMLSVLFIISSVDFIRGRKTGNKLYLHLNIVLCNFHQITGWKRLKIMVLVFLTCTMCISVLFFLLLLYIMECRWSSIAAKIQFFTCNSSQSSGGGKWNAGILCQIWCC